MEAQIVSSQKVLDGEPFVLSLDRSVPGLKAAHLSSFQLLVSAALCLPVSGAVLARPSSVTADRKVNPQSSVSGQNSSALLFFPRKCKSSIEIWVLSLPLFRLIEIFRFNSNNIHWGMIEIHIHSSWSSFFLSFSVENSVTHRCFLPGLLPRGFKISRLLSPSCLCDVIHRLVLRPITGLWEHSKQEPW